MQIGRKQGLFQHSSENLYDHNLFSSIAFVWSQFPEMLLNDWLPSSEYTSFSQKIIVLNEPDGMEPVTRG